MGPALEVKTVSMTKLYPSQYFGIGDIIFTQTLARRLAHRYGAQHIIWGALPQFTNGLNRAYGANNIYFYDYEYLSKRSGIDYNSRGRQLVRGAYYDGWPTDYIYEPIRWADAILGVPYERCMRAKYDLYDMDFREWKEHAMWKRDEAREEELFELLGISEGERYLLYNTTFQSDFNGNIDFLFSGEITRVVFMRPIEGFSLFDWAKVMERAIEIHSVSTATLYMFELLDLKCPIHLYPRPTDPGFKQVEYLFTKPYTLH